MNPDDQTNSTTDSSTPNMSALMALSQDQSQQGNNSNPDAAVNPNMGTPGPSSMGPMSPMMLAAMRFMTANQQNNQEGSGIRTAQVGPFGTHILQTNSPGDRVAQMNNTITSGLNGLAAQYIQGQQQQNRSSFIQSVHQIMGTNAPQQDKMNALLDLQDAHGTDYGLGLNKIASSLGVNRQQPQSPAQQIQQLMQLAQTNPDLAHTQATANLGANYQTKYPKLADAINSGANSTVMGMANQALQKVYGPNMQIDPVEFAKSGKVVPTPNQPVSSDPNYSTLPPDQALQKLTASNPAYADYLQMYASGHGGKISSTNRSSQQQKLMQDLAFFYPGINVDNINQRVDTLKDFSSGKSSQNIVSFNTALQHLNYMNDLIPKLNNSPSEWFNNIAQPLEAGTGIGNNPNVAEFNNTKKALSGELATVYKNSGATQEEINSIQDGIKSASNPQNLQSAVKSAAVLMYGKLQGLQAKWGNTYNSPNDLPGPGGKSIITPVSQQIIQKLAGGTEGIPLSNMPGNAGIRTNLPNGNSNSTGNVQLMTATNPQTGARIQSSDGGQTWQQM